MNNEFILALYDLMNQRTPVVVVTLTRTIGSAPQDAGAKMIVGESGLIFGTVGGGKVENLAIKVAKEMLKSNLTYQDVEWNLQKDVGMTCGGKVYLSFEYLNQKPWTIHVFGAGHVGQALVRLLTTLDCQVICYDQRLDWLEKLPRHPKLITKHHADLKQCTQDIKDEDFVVLMTMGHATDKPIMLELLKRKKPIAYLGIIGSQSKRNQLDKDIANEKIKSKQKIHCPIGLKIGTNHPAEIAISVAAELLEIRDKQD